MRNKKKYKYLIVFHSFSPNDGGSVVTYKLCDILNDLGETAMMCPYPVCGHFPSIDATNYLSLLKELIKHPIKHLRPIYTLTKYYRNTYKPNKIWKCPVMSPLRAFLSFPLKNWIVVYHQEISGNYLGAKNRVRWFTHNPGHFSGIVDYRSGELYFRYSGSFGSDFVPLEGSHMAKNYLTISTTPECYNAENTASERIGTAYILRKGRDKKIVHDLSDSILLDGKSHEEVAEILKKVKMLISYDSATAYSYFSLLCHCPSVVILGEGESPDKYRPNKEAQSKYAYSIEDALEKDWEPSYKWAEELNKGKATRSIESVKNFIKESQDFFKEKS